MLIILQNKIDLKNTQSMTIKFFLNQVKTKNNVIIAENRCYRKQDKFSSTPDSRLRFEKRDCEFSAQCGIYHVRWINSPPLTWQWTAWVAQYWWHRETRTAGPASSLECSSWWKWRFLWAACFEGNPSPETQ